MTERVFGWWVLASLGAHAVGIVAVVPLATSASPRPSAAVPIEVVRIAPPPEPLQPPVRKATAPRSTVKMPTQPAAPAPAPAPLLQDVPRPEPTAQATESSVPDQRLLASANGSWTMPGATLDAPIGTGKLLASPGPAAYGTPGGANIASKDEGAGLTSFARPLGGYQTKPRYPEAARREGIEGVTTLRFQVLASGRVGSVVVARSAGHPELDRSAIEAVKTWLFEPARRGKEAVTVWVVLPVRFSLQVE
jgi:protein TonB